MLYQWVCCGEVRKQAAPIDKLGGEPRQAQGQGAADGAGAPAGPGISASWWLWSGVMATALLLLWGSRFVFRKILEQAFRQEVGVEAETVIATIFTDTDLMWTPWTAWPE